MAKLLITILFVVFARASFSQTDTIYWEPANFEKQHVDFFDKCEAQYFDTTGTKSTVKIWTSTWVDGRYSNYVIIDSSQMLLQFKWRKATDEEMINRKRESLSHLNSPAIGRNLPDKDFTDTNGKVYNFQDLKNKLVYANFWFVGCNGCEIERDRLNQLYEQYNKQVLFISFSISKDKKTRKYLEKNDFRLPTIVLSKEDRKDFEYISGFPTNMVIVNGKVETALNGLTEGTFLVLDEELSRNLEK